MTTIIAALGGVAAIVGGIIWLAKYSAWSLQKTPEQTKEGIDAEVDKEVDEMEKTGRPPT